MNENNSKCPYCNSKDVSIDKAEKYIPPMKVIILMIFFVLIGYSTTNILRGLSAVGIGLTFYYIYKQEKKLKNRFKLHCLSCHKDYYFYDYSDRNESSFGNAETQYKVMSTVLKTAASLGSEKAKRSVEAMEEGVRAGLMKGLMNIPLDSYRDKIHKQLTDIKKLILQESPLINNEKSQLDNLAAIDEDIRKYMFTELQKNLFKIQAKYPKLSLRTQEDIDNLFNDLSVPEETKQQILFEYYKIADEIINGSFVTYVENKYEVNIKSLMKDNTSQ